MGDRSGHLLERAFNKMHGFVGNVQSEQPLQQQPEQQQQPHAAVDPATVAIKRMLDCWKVKDYFKLMGLPDPVADELGRPQWACTAGDVSRAYRKLSVLVHPDKIPGEEAREAFEALNEAHRILKDPGRLEEVLRDAGVRARKQREQEESRVVGSEQRAALVAAKNASAKRLRKEEGASFDQTIRAQLLRRQEEAKRKAHAQANARTAASGVAEQPRKDGDSSDEEGQGAARAARMAALHKRRKPTIMH
mmetsp:Transcript_17372/g.29762  ORF Transcript_17372/g.29762 Transcript_17372/m.29762 type:complete len:249 (-) Transcript_17372:215-961(-)|eukprot:CAMPEP_0119108490 /NCGR_PEP_ID=MMETSP1180-20130426/14662_1 /TAXON_ID=3052 ORGANISM="Chlamydomonas cf sp, Strain CCMP681" /NCGR_SAMPLE_ID=MMETSP1180 /ASSEMBLY_ACC=CAM_ASM_000741 /LENGTH=248 /DNA_ID=CAMNT_0007094109 /DNA_START=159 /DNA_END=905 /DNA_ORIENTATION=-